MIVPLARSPDWRRPPVVTLVLILLNVLIFFGLQLDDDQAEHEAFDYYFSTDLPAIELPAYRRYLDDPDNPTAFPELRLYLDEEGPAFEHQLARLMIYDGPFMSRLDAGEIITPDHPRHAEWRRLRQAFEARLAASTTWRFSQVNYRASLLTSFTSMFLHGSFDHLLGNMIFLFLFGYVVEAILGWRLYLAGYLLSGLTADLLYYLAEPDSGLLALGASGAIFGLSGMYVVLFGLRKIRFFYTLLFYFGYFRAPAIVLLPIWLAYQLYEQFFAPSNINNLAHIGGLLGGALFALAVRRWGQPLLDTDYLDAEERQRAFDAKYAEGLEALAAMDAPRARRIFNELAEEQPDNVTLMTQRYNVAKLDPNSDDIHQAALRILTLPGADEKTVKLQHDTFVDYVRRVQPNVRLSPEQMMNLALRFAARGFLADAEKIIVHLTNRLGDFRRNPEGLMALATHFRRANDRQKADHYLQLLRQRYPDSPEARHGQLSTETGK